MDSLMAKWLLAVVAAAVGFGSVSVLVAVRRLYFLAAGLSHAALLAAVASLPLYYVFGVSVEAWSLALMVLIVMVYAALERRGVDTQVSSAVFVSLTASLSVILMYYVLTSYPYTSDLWAYILGDPLLASWDTVTSSLAVAVVALGVTLLTFWEHVCIGIDRDTARMAGLRVNLYDYSLLVVLAIVTAGLLRLVGFVLAHVYVLLPGAIAVTAASRAGRMLPIALTVALVSGVAGLYLAVTVNLAPSGVIGLIMLAAYIAALLSRRR